MVTSSSLGVRVVSALIMAGQAAKKAQKQEKAAASTWGPIIAVVNLIYVVLMFVKGAWSRRLVTAFVFTSLLYSVCYNLVVTAGDGTLFSEYALDLLVSFQPSMLLSSPRDLARHITTSCDVVTKHQSVRASCLATLTLISHPDARQAAHRRGAASQPDLELQLVRTTTTRFDDDDMMMTTRRPPGRNGAVDDDVWNAATGLERAASDRRTRTPALALPTT